MVRGEIKKSVKHESCGEMNFLLNRRRINSFGVMIPKL